MPHTPFSASAAEQVKQPQEMASSDQPVVKSSEPLVWFRTFPREVQNKIYQQMWMNTQPVKFLLKGSRGVAVVSYDTQEPTKDPPHDAVFLPTWLLTSRVFMEEALNELYLYSSCVVYTHKSHQNIRGPGNLLDLSQFHEMRVITDVSYWVQHSYDSLMNRSICHQMRVNLIPNRIQNLELCLFTISGYYGGLVAMRRVMPFLDEYSRFSKDRCSELKSLTINVRCERGILGLQPLIDSARHAVGQRFTEKSCDVYSLPPPNPLFNWEICMKFEPK